MREDWNRIKMVDACELITCGVAARPNYVDIGIPFLSAKNVKEGKIVYKGYNCITEENHKELTKKNKPLVGDLLYTRVGSFGEAAVIEQDIEFSVFVSLTLIKPKRELLNSYYLRYYLNSHEVKTLAKNSITSSGVGNLNVGTVRKFPIPIPPIQEQKQIVAILDKAFTSIDQAKANIEKNIVNAKELFQSKLNEIFSQKGDGWEEKTLKEISIDFGRGKSKNRPRNDKKLFGGEYPFVQTGDIRNTGKILKTFSQTYNEVGLAQSKLWTKGTICITIAANIAETAILDFDSCFPDSMIGLIVDQKKADSNYTYYALQFLKSRLQELGKGSAQDNINLGTFQKQYFPFPNIEKQKEIVVILDNINEQTIQIETNYNKKLEDLEELKKSILQKAFSGELTQKEVVV
jgi:type I restriction enzyme S subunit